MRGSRNFCQSGSHSDTVDEGNALHENAAMYSKWRRCQFQWRLRIEHCALNLGSTQPVAIFTFELTLQVTNSKNTIQFYFVVLKVPGLNDSDSNITWKQASGMEWALFNMLLFNETRHGENTSIIIKVNASSFEWYIVCLSKMSLDKDTKKRSELLEHPSYVTFFLIFLNCSLFFAMVEILICFQLSQEE